MEYVNLGRSGVQVSRICLGCMNFGSRADEAESTRVIHEAMELGINFLDTANVYQLGVSEEIVGKALAEPGRRDRVVLATKVTSRMGQGPNMQGSSRYHVIKQCEDSLRRLRTDRIDLYQLHWLDRTTPLDEILRVMDDLVRQGKVLYVGTSKWPPAVLAEALMLAQHHGWERIVCEQPPYNILDRSVENELLWVCQRLGIATIPWAPLGSGILAGQYRKDKPIPATSRAATSTLLRENRLTEAAIEVVEQLLPLAKDKQISLAQLALAWLLGRPGVTSPIVGARTVEHVRSAVEALDIHLTEEDCEFIDKLVPAGTAVSNYYDINVHRPLREALRPECPA